MKKNFTLFLILCMALSLNAQKHRVYFIDKGENLEMLENPRLFLSSKSLARKAKHQVPVDAADLPVNQPYLNALRQMNLEVEFASRWFNYALVQGKLPEELYSLPFVKRVERVKPYRVHFASAEATANSFEYGAASNQIEMLNGHVLHQMGYTGKGVSIAVIDGGFKGTDTISAFDSLRTNGRIAGTYNFVNDTPNVYVAGGHGTSVLSTMGANIPHEMVGTAPHATYWLLRSEDEDSETPVEMDYWLAAAEFADSVGADVINSSLGYHDFDNSSDDFSYSDMDGNTALVTQAADMAAAKGIAVVVSAGNEGSSAWQYITAPADGDSVLTVGAVDYTGDYVSFSSRGPTADGRVKPDVVAQGVAAVANSAGIVVPSSGTSFSSPIIAGLTACLVQAFPTSHNWELYHKIRLSASQYFNPDSKLGYGIPDFEQAFHLSQEERIAEQDQLRVYPIPFTESLNIEIPGLQKESSIEVQIYDTRSQLVYSLQHRVNAAGKLEFSPHLGSGVYLLKIHTPSQQFTQKIMR